MRSTFEVSAARARAAPRMRSGGGVLCIAAAQLLVGLCLLGLYEGYKRYFFGRYLADLFAMQRAQNATGPPPGSFSDSRAAFESPLDWRSPMGFTFYLAIINNTFAICGLAGVINAQRELVVAFFAYNAAAMVVSFHFFVDMVTDAGISYQGEPPELSSYEKATASFVFINFALSIAASVFAMRAVEEIRTKQREDYNRLTVLSDTLAFEADHP